MSTRRSHFKSHTGCITCKRRHVKCDESGPPCNRCQARGVACEYAKITRHAQHPLEALNDSTKTEETTKSPLKTPDTLAANPIFPTTRHHLGLQLMHRWSTTTFKCCCTPGTGDEALWQFTVPALALEHEFLLNGLLALSAFEIANALFSENYEDTSSSNFEKYIHAAFEYQDLALSTFRAQLESPSPYADHRASIYFSLMLLVHTFASVRFRRKQEKNILQTAIAHFELIRGAVHIADSEEEHQISKNEYVQRLIPFKDLPLSLLDPPVAEVMVKLGELNDQRIIDTAQDVHERRMQQIAFWEACKKGISLLQECFQKCFGPIYRGYALGWLNMTGEEYIKALKTKDDIALLILMLWGVLVGRMSDDIWWAKGFGRSLVDEISSDAFSGAVGTDSSIRDIVLRVQQLI